MEGNMQIENRIKIYTNAIHRKSQKTIDILTFQINLLLVEKSQGKTTSAQPKKDTKIE